MGTSKNATGYEAVFGYIFGYTTSYSDYKSGATYQYYDSSSSSSDKYYHYYIPASLTSVTITGGNIASYAFYNCRGLTSITIGNSVTTIGNYAFYNCSGLTRIDFNATKAQWNAISKGSNWKDNTGLFTVYCTDGNISKSDT